MKECECEYSSFWILYIVLIFSFVPLFVINSTENKNISSEPPELKLSDYPKTEEHCKICSQCKARWDLIEKKQITWDSPVCCSEGFEIGMQEFREKLRKVRN